MKKVVRLTESDLVNLVKRIISEQEDTLVDEIDAMADELGDDPTPLQTIINKIEDAGHDVGTFIKKLKRNARKVQRQIGKNMMKLRFKKGKPNFSTGMDMYN
jgi:uncharacterized protein YoxC